MVGGTGQPNDFFCAQCRKGNHFRQGAGMSLLGGPERVRLTGRKHKMKKHAGIRTDGHNREYLCLDCRHRGWSNHIALAGLESRQQRL